MGVQTVAHVAEELETGTHGEEELTRRLPQTEPVLVTSWREKTEDDWSKTSECSSLPRLPKLVMMSVKKVRKRGDAAAKYEILTVSSILLVRRTRNTKRGTTRKL